MTMYHKKSKNQQRQIKGLSNLGEFKSKHIDGIKISRLNDLASKEDGNPLAKMHKLQHERERRESVLNRCGA